jgi:hypothetical protein
MRRIQVFTVHCTEFFCKRWRAHVMGLCSWSFEGSADAISPDAPDSQ